ncbi:RabGAP/TBC [Dacryopinax primogenitus]|uniref:RabGAP/TBC n=1 Tax=Dacryopinax primogenitus (strain DJM 731) TaxID=1858805 RepID=M5GAB7_DACPD|nr:RabGAP/TBC [Dacryopinax primogenitus]EJU05764.1 RabGAP/TBC [Dacryopinax primogenitus]
MGGGPAPFSRSQSSLSMKSTGSMVEITRDLENTNLENTPVLTVPEPQKEDEKFRLLYARSKVYIYPTAYARDNVPGWVALVKQEAPQPVYLLSWLPESLLQRKGHEELEKYVHVEAEEYDEQDGVLISPPVPRGELYAFSVPLSMIYSIIMSAPTLSAWYGTMTLNLISGSTLPKLYFHDDESRSLHERPREGSLTPKWGGEALLHRLRSYCTVLKSSLQSGLYLIDPSLSDKEAHSTILFDDGAVDDIMNPVPKHRRPSKPSKSGQSQSAPPSQRNSILHEGLSGSSSSNSTFERGVLTAFSHITQQARHAAQTILSHPLAQPIVPHLPEPVKSLVHADGEWSGWVEKGGVGEYESARVYLARWARIVAEAGERARQQESPADPDSSLLHVSSDLGVFEVLATSNNLPPPKPTRNPKAPIQEHEWDAWFSSTGRPTVEWSFVRTEIFRRGLTPEVRPKAWPFLLGVFSWTTDAIERATLFAKQKAQYNQIKSLWKDNEEVLQREDVVEERHRIDVDCRRTDRTHPYFAMPEEWTGSMSEFPQSPVGQSPANEHVQNLMSVLTTYNFYEKELGYVQGMSDLCSPLYVVFEGDESMTFWCFTRFMERMKPNFLRDQSGMKKQLLTLQQLIAVMDPELYRHFEKTESLNLFFCFRWILIIFKREFSFDEVMSLWEILWTDCYSTQFVLFVALAVLESHRNVILRYLVEFDEILKYCNDLSMTIDLDSTLAQAEVLFLSFQQRVAAIEARRKEQDASVDAVEGIRKRRGSKAPEDKLDAVELPVLSENLMELLENERG